MKKRSKSTKKKERRRKPHKEASSDDLIAEADAAMNALDFAKGLALYKTASNMLRGKLDLKVDNSETQTETVLKLAQVLGKVGEAKVSMGDPDGAKEEFSKGISVLNSEALQSGYSCYTVSLHETRASLHLFFGQLSSDEEALAAYNKGVQELEACIALREAACNEKRKKSENDMMALENASEEEQTLLETRYVLAQGNVSSVLAVLSTKFASSRPHRKQLCGAYSSLVELYLTDLCYGENAEVECESNLQSALKITDPVDGQPFVDALQSLTSLRLSQNRGREAARYILRVYDKIKTGCEALAALVGLGNANDDEQVDQAVELVEVEAANNLPGFEFRVQSSKLLLECASVLKAAQENNQSTEEMAEERRCVLACIQVLGSLIAENDEVVEIWYLLGCAFAALTPSSAEVACQYWERAKDMLIKVMDCLDKEISEIGDCNDGEEAIHQLQNVKDQLQEVNEKLQEYGHCENDAMDER